MFVKRNQNALLTSVEVRRHASSFVKNSEVERKLLAGAVMIERCILNLCFKKLTPTSFKSSVSGHTTERHCNRDFALSKCFINSLCARLAHRKQLSQCFSALRQATCRSSRIHKTQGTQ